ncbi:hypothetical protein BCR34DRAFT_599257 [Clohesyomyces aquaticus]|uniref:Uncharacterized protein n=1 Tax=Clohesyomyces aquaticus TaxID=1231657 RepID=A0A1Y1ZWW5_9PLEO|nr:hypothetical protein BCR34DRAFT_599257 [Clohesyomyces aquaticus]
MPHATLPASLIFSPKGLKHFRRWQIQCSTRKPSDSIPSALEYAAFVQWRKQRREYGFSALGWSDERRDDDAISPSCGSGHRSSRVRPAKCPLCVIRAHLQFQTVLADAWANLGGPFAYTLEESPEREAAQEAWYWAKLELVKTIYEYELENMSESAVIGDALDLYWSSLLDPFEKQVEVKVGLERTDSGLGMSGKRVRFKENTVFKVGRQQRYFGRKSVVYEPGKYACGGFKEGDSGFEKDEEVVGTDSEYASDSEDEDEDESDQDDDDCPEGDFIVFG